MDGYEYEKVCAEYLRRKGFRKVRVTKASRDQGVDILAKKRRKTYAVQCKYYATPVGNKAVQEVYAGASFYGCDRAMVITNASFTKGAYELAETLDVELVSDVDPSRTMFGIVDLIAALLMLAVIGCYIAERKELFSLGNLIPGVMREWLYLGAGMILVLLIILGSIRRNRYRFRDEETEEEDEAEQ
ncbi:MAG: restriction endonuclease [Lachnospiraceae bacterium]|nr:restriction endonuclease [Lachnospiraceae bacterium]